MINIQNISHMTSEKPRMIMIQYDGITKYLSPQTGDRPKGYVMRQIPTEVPRQDVETGAFVKDQHGNIVTLTTLVSVLVETEEPGVSSWLNCPNELWDALLRGTWRHTYTTGKRVRPEMLEGVGWHKQGMKVFELLQTTAEVGKDLATLDDVARSLERLIAEQARAHQQKIKELEDRLAKEAPKK